VIVVVVDVGAELATAGLRERKKQRTRTMLIDAAVKLCDRQGYERTTVDQIAAAVEVSPRTFARYFPTKDAVILTLVDELVEAVDTHLREVLLEVPPLQALLTANVDMLTAARNRVGVLTSTRVGVILRIFNATPMLRTLASGFRVHPLAITLAHRMGVSLDDQALRLTLDVWVAIVLAAWGDLSTHVDIAELDIDAVPELMIERLHDTFVRFTGVVAGISAPV
jgi:AcrR family transcriptional regulator